MQRRKERRSRSIADVGLRRGEPLDFEERSAVWIVFAVAIWEKGGKIVVEGQLAVVV